MDERIPNHAIFIVITMTSLLKISAFKGLKLPNGSKYSFLPQLCQSLCSYITETPTQFQSLQKEAVEPKNIAARQYEEIPKTDTFLGVNWELLRNLKSLVEFLEKQVKKAWKDI